MTVLTMTRGDSATFDITLTDEDGEPLDLTDVHLTFTATRSTWAGVLDVDGIWSSEKTTLLIEKTELDGITVAADPKTGVATLAIEPVDTEDWTDDQCIGALPWDVEVRTDGGSVATPLSGILVVRADITLPVAS